jgi:hypothetical protein
MAAAATAAPIANNTAALAVTRHANTHVQGGSIVVDGEGPVIDVAASGHFGVRVLVIHVDGDGPDDADVR